MENNINHLLKVNKSLKEMDIWNYEKLAYAVRSNQIALASANHYMLVKLPVNEFPDSIFQTFYEIQLRGYVPIIESAEQNIEFNRNPNILYAIVKRGALVQIKASSLTGLNGKAIKKFAIRLCKHNLVHLITSKDVKLEKNQISLKHVYKDLQKKCSKNYVENLKANAKHITTNTDFHTLTPIKFKK